MKYRRKGYEKGGNNTPFLFYLTMDALLLHCFLHLILIEEVLPV